MNTLTQTQIPNTEDIDGASAQRRPDGVSEFGVPPTDNMGGKFPISKFQYVDRETGEVFLMCPTGEGAYINLIPLSSENLHPYAAITDYLNCTFKFDQESESLPDLFQDILTVFGPKFFPIIERGHGIYRYQKSFNLGESSALLAIGGQAGTVLISIPGEACSLLHNKWGEVVEFLDLKLKAKITRWDGAVDDYSGSHPVDWAVEQYHLGNFVTGGNKPKCKNAGNWSDHQGEGRTFYVGKRQNGKLIRIYEKGMQLGTKWHPWVRWEVELHNRDRVVPWDVLINPAHYFVGCYPKLLDWVQTEMIPIRTIQKQLQMGYDHLTNCAKNSYGRHVKTMLEVERDPKIVVEKLMRAGTPKRLRHSLPDRVSDFIQSAADIKGDGE